MIPHDYPFIRQVRSPLTDKQLTPLDPRCRVVQFASPLTDKDFQRLADFLAGYPQVTLRIYDHYREQVINLDFLRHFPFLEKFSVDVLPLTSLQGIEYLTATLRSLAIGQTKTKAISLRFLSSFPNLRELYLEGHTKDIEVISCLRRLQKLTLRYITLPGLDILKPLDALRWFALELGGTKDLSALPEIGKLKYLEIFMVKGLANLAPISDVTSLEYLFLQALKQVTALPYLGNLTNLRRLHLETMNGITNLQPIMAATALLELICVDTPQLNPSDFAPLVDHPSLDRVLIGLGSMTKNQEVEELLPFKRLNYSQDGYTFEYFREEPDQ